MIGIVSVTGHGTCRHCGGVIYLGSAFGETPVWHHEEGGRDVCPGAPVAEPVAVKPAVNADGDAST